MELKKIYFVMLMMILSSGIMAQSLKLGIKAGADINKIDGESFKQQFTFGYQVGAFATIGITDKFGIQPEVLFSQVKFDTASNFSQVYQVKGLTDIKLKYLKIPILLNYKANPFLTLQLGPQFGVLLDKNKNLVNNGKSAFKNGDFSMVGGLQVNILKLRLYGRYALGLSDLNDINDQSKWKSQSFQIGVGVTL